jgi:hypothetical protein
VYGDTDHASSGGLTAIGSYKALIAYLHGTDLGIVSGTAMRIGDAEKNHALLADIHALSAKLLHERQRT